MTRLWAWIELTRGANLPTVWSNLLIGWLIAAAFGANFDGDSLPRLGLLLAGLSLVYTAGMFLNDAWDVAWDTPRHPGRPIPSGRLSQQSVRTAGLACLILGSTLAAFTAPWLVLPLGALGVLILVYTALHKIRPALGAALMGSCRALLPLIGFLSNPPPAGDGLPLVLAHAASLGLATVGISVLARHETTGSEPDGAARILPLLAILPVPLLLLARGETPWLPMIWACGLLLLVGWSRRRIADIGQRVSARIAGLCLVDYLAWLAIRPQFDPSDPLAMGGLVILLFLGTALALRRLMPST
jgi:4-hydroxybenzoate polyprenyltransferase